MQFRFDAHQPYQVRAIESVVALFDGQPKVSAEMTISATGGFSAIPNQLDLDDTALLANLQVVQAENNLPPDSALQYLEGAAPTAGGEAPVQFANFSVEMETGTGKTYVYIRTILELFRAYGLRKFIVVVPSIAVREGVLKTLAITKPHLLEIYGNLPYRYQVYDSGNLAQVRHFAGSDAVEILVMTIDSFNRASNVIHQSTDRLQGETPIHLIQAARPVLILDEPQNMESELRIKALAALDPLLALRYSATHRNPYNVVYRLTPYDAYQQGLVKKIEVGSVVQSDDENRPFLRLEGITSVKNTVTARLTLHRRMADETVREQTVTIRGGDKLQEKAGRSHYAPYVVDEINPAGRFVRFTNGDEIRIGETQGTDKEAIFAAQIHETVKEHIQKQRRLRAQGIKVLSLFFIDRVDNYAPPDSLLRRLFRESFDELKAGSPEWRKVSAEEVQAAYFAERRTRAGEVILEDSATGEAARDQQAYELIMRNKEQLLSFEEPVSFIFSHSALREGWDNPNIFQICTLHQTGSEMKKRQEVGRGIRLAVNQQGERVHDDAVNLLTVIANESYDRYVNQLQSEIETEYGREGLPPPPKRKGSPKARLRKLRVLSEEFRTLWEQIKHKTRYSVRIDTERLLCDVVEELDRAHIPAPRVTFTKGLMEVREDVRAFGAVQTTGTRTVRELDRSRDMPNLVAVMDDLLRRSEPRVRLTRATLLEVFRRTSQQQAAMRNPHGFASETVRLLRSKLADHLVNGIQYERTGEWYDLSQILDEKEVELFGRFVVRANSKRSIYDRIACDSAVESKFVQDLERRKDVHLYVKLPRWFTVQTPVGEYNPDWAIVMDGSAEDKPVLYLVRETKDTTNLDDLRPDERRKVRCGEKHFRDALGVSYRVVTSAAELP